MMWLLLALAMFITGWAVVRFSDGYRSNTIDGRRHPDDVHGQVLDFERARAALAKRDTPRRWYAHPNNDNDDTETEANQ